MKAIILSAGQGGRLLPLTETLPKCLLSLGEQTIVEHQIVALNDCGVSDIAVVTGFAAGAVEQAIRDLKPTVSVPKTIFNPFFNVADNANLNWFDASTPSKHPVFAKVTENYELLVQISTVPTNNDNPITPIKMEKIEISGVPSK